MKRQLAVILSFLSLTAASQQLLVLPYIQPGNSSSGRKDEKVIVWQTDSVPATFRVLYRTKSEAKPLTARLSLAPLKLKGKSTLLYRAKLSKLNVDAQYVYEVMRNNETIVKDTFHSRSTRDHVRFVALGDYAAGTIQQASVAYQISLQQPEFVLTTGDNVYQNGLEQEYRKNLFPYYLADKSAPAVGARLMNKIPFYMLLGNHDVRSNDLDQFPDGLAYFYYADLPLNAPIPDHTLMPAGSPTSIEAFRKNTSSRFPGISNYSFEYGNVHITCLDANDYANPLDPAIVQWIRSDIQKSKATWKIVAFHQPAFNSSNAHYDQQFMRLLAPVFESLKIDLVLTGHVHNYQRSVPLRFAPKINESGDQFVISPEGRVDGTFTLDTEFDGSADTTPNGIIYIVSGAGGAPLYDMNISEKPELWKHDIPGNWVPFTTKLISHIHSFTLIETKDRNLTLKQISLYGEVLDSIMLTK